MGAGGSKPEGGSKHVFSSNTPVRFSQELIDSLQASPETDSSRARTLDLHIAERVAAELADLQKKEDDALHSLREKISSESSPTSADDGKTDKESWLPQVPPPGDAAAKESSRQEQSSAKVFAELEKLRKGLDERKKVREMPKDVEKAREELVGCLRTNDRRPLDCWREVEAFKGRISKMEEDFIGRVL